MQKKTIHIINVPNNDIGNVKSKTVTILYAVTMIHANAMKLFLKLTLVV